MDKMRKLSFKIDYETYDPSKIGENVTTDKKYKLMIKTHWDTGINYLCITKRKDYRQYKGSGVRWKKLLESHPGPVCTWLIFSSDDIDEFNLVCQYHSDFYNIPFNEDFANLVPEYGYEGNQGNLPAWWQCASEEDKRVAKAKIKVTREKNCLEKYGVHHTMHLALAKLKEKCAAMGYDHVMRIPEVAAKCRAAGKKTLMERYGVEHNMHIPGLSKQVDESRRRTLKEMYGVEYILQLEGMAERVRIKREATLMEKYGVPNISMVPGVAEARSDKIKAALAKRVYEKCPHCDFESKNIKFHEPYCPHNPNRKERKTEKCEHCGIETSPSNIKRWHNDNCKLKGKQNGE